MHKAMLFTAACALGSCGPSNLAPLLGISPENPTTQMVTQAYSGRTMLTVDRRHGAQVRYFGENGRTFLWYPGNNRSVEADWRIQDAEGDSFALCFQHGTTSFTPVSGSTGRQWRCSGSVTSNLARTDQVIEGDLFNLSSGAVPFVMPYSTNLTIGDLAQSADLEPNEINYVYQWRG